VTVFFFPRSDVARTRSAQTIASIPHRSSPLAPTSLGLAPLRQSLQSHTGPVPSLRRRSDSLRSDNRFSPTRVRSPRSGVARTRSAQTIAPVQHGFGPARPHVLGRLGADGDRAAGGGGAVHGVDDFVGGDGGSEVGPTLLA
jgi:hypothetical protein